MDQDFENQERIYQYLQGDLKGKDLKQFQDDLKTNKSLAEELNFSQSMFVTLKNKEALAIKQQLKQIISTKNIEPDFDALKEFESLDNPTLEDKINKQSNNRFGKGLLGGLFSIGLLTIFSLSFFGIWNPFTTTKATNPLVSPHLIQFENVISANATNNPALDQGMSAYTDADYATAIPILQRYLQNNKDPNVLLYLGLSHLLNSAADKAIPILERTVDTSLPPMLSVAKWYLALAYIEAEQLPAARVSLMELQNIPDYEPRATALLNALAESSIQ